MFAKPTVNTQNSQYYNEDLEHSMVQCGIYNYSQTVLQSWMPMILARKQKVQEKKPRTKAKKNTQGPNRRHRKTQSKYALDQFYLTAHDYICIEIK